MRSLQVRDFRLRLEEALKRSPDLVDAEIHALVKILADLDDMDFGALLRLLRPNPKRAGHAAVSNSSKRAAVDPNEIVARLRAKLLDDDAFAAELDLLHEDRGVTKQVLTQVFMTLFDRTRGIPKRATRDELLRLISDERNILVRNEKMGQVLGRRIVPAE